MKKLNKLNIRPILENKQPEGQRLGCLMLLVDFPGWEDHIKKIVEEKDTLYVEKFGKSMETEPHITCLYGFDESVEFERDIKPHLEPFVTPIIFGPSTINCFESGEYDVLKYDIESPDLVKLNSSLSALPHTNKFEYHPYMTISYIKKGVKDKYVGKIDESMEKEMSSVKFKFVSATGEKTYYEIKQ